MSDVADMLVEVRQIAWWTVEVVEAIPDSRPVRPPAATIPVFLRDRDEQTVVRSIVAAQQLSERLGGTRSYDNPKTKVRVVLARAHGLNPRAPQQRDQRG